MQSCKDLQFCEPSSEERSAGNLHATLCGSRYRETGPATRWERTGFLAVPYPDFFEWFSWVKQKIMQIKLFTIPVGDSGAAEQELNMFLKANKVLEIENRLISNKNSACWCFCVRYAESAANPSASDFKARVDYRKVLDEPTFNKFSALREKRKKAAIDEGVSAFIIFTDEELAALARLDEVTEKNMLAIKGIGEKKVERFARYFTEKLETNEATGTAD